MEAYYVQQEPNRLWYWYGRAVTGEVFAHSMQLFPDAKSCSFDLMLHCVPGVPVYVLPSLY